MITKLEIKTIDDCPFEFRGLQAYMCRVRHGVCVGSADLGDPLSCPLKEGGVLVQLKKPEHKEAPNDKMP